MGAHYEILGNTGALFSIADPVTEEICRGVIRRPQAAAVLCVAELGPATVIITRRRPRAEEYGISPRARLRFRPRARANERAVVAEQRACVGDVLVGPLSVALRGFFGHARSP